MTRVTGERMAESLYQELLLKHHKMPVGYGLRDEFTHFEEGENGVCGDEIRVSAKLNSEIIESVGFSGDSCAICRASASIMCGLVQGKSRNDVKQTISTALKFLFPGNDDSPFLKGLDEEMLILSNVHQYPIRLQCARLPWSTLNKLTEDW